MNEDEIQEILFSGYGPNPVFAEISTGNWIYALDRTIRGTYGSSPEEWKDGLSDSFSRIQNTGSFPLLGKSLRALSQGMMLTLSFENRKSKPFHPWNTVGVISDFYYCITNLLDVIIMAQTGEEILNHTQRINLFGGISKKLPHPFDMLSSFSSESDWRETLLVTKDHFKFEFPSLGLSTSSASEGLINRWHDSMDPELGGDILLGYLRGTTGFIWEMKCKEFKERKGIGRINSRPLKNEINPSLKKMKINFLNCLYRYRTKAHYRDFIYLGWDCFEPSIRKSNNYIDDKFLDSIANISNFTVCVVFRFLKAKMGRENSKKVINVIQDTLKEHDPPWQNYFSADP